MDDVILLGDNLEWLRRLESESFQLVYADPPFNTGKRQTSARRTMTRSDNGDRIGFAGNRYTTEVGIERGYDDSFDDLLGFLRPRMEEVRRVLSPTGVVYLHMDWRWVHDVKVRVMDEIFGREAFISELVWAYDYGAKPKTRWPQKHDTILVYAKDPRRTPFHVEQVEREPYMAPGMVSKEKAERGKLPTSCFSSDTDVLTRRGWVPFPRLLPTDEVATLTDDRRIRFTTLSAVHTHRYVGEMIHCRNETTDLLVTPDHSMYLRGDSDGYGFVEARSLLDGPIDAYHVLGSVTDGLVEEHPLVPSLHVRRSPYDGLVHCCTVEPHHTLVVRRDGRSSVCGNCIWHTIVPTNGKERTGYPTQKPMGLVRRFLQAHTVAGDRCLDPFAGSGTLGAVAAEMDRRAVLVDENPEAVEVMRSRLGWPVERLS